MKTISVCIRLLLLIIPINICLSQTLFRNLDFERATIVLVEGSPYYPYEAVASNAIPNWKAYTWSANADYSVAYNDRALDSPLVSIHDTNSARTTVLKGRYTLLLQSSPFFGIDVSIAQTGWVPLLAKSIRFIADYRVLQVTFNGHELPVMQLGQLTNNPTAYIWGADISAFANQTGELRFSGYGPLDDIEFSKEPVTLPRPVLSQPQMRSDGNVEFRLSAQIGPHFTVQFSTNLLDWYLLTNPATGFVPRNFTIIDATASNAPARFYRSVSP